MHILPANLEPLDFRLSIQFLHYGRGGGDPATNWNFIDNEGRAASVNGRIYARFDRGDVIRVAATEGMGIGLLAPLIVKRELSESKLVEVLAEISAVEFAVHVIYPSRRHLPAHFRTFIDELRRYLDRNIH